MSICYQHLFIRSQEIKEAEKTKNLLEIINELSEKIKTLELKLITITSDVEMLKQELEWRIIEN